MQKNVILDLIGKQRSLEQEVGAKWCLFFAFCYFLVKTGA